MTIQVPSASVALAPVVEACKRRQSLSHHGTTSPIFVIGEIFMIGDDIWKGIAIITLDALFLLRIERQGGFATPAPGLIQDATAVCPSAMPNVFYSDLPAILTDDPNWPKPSVKQCQVSVLLRDRIREVRPVSFSNDIAFVSEHAVVRVTCAMEGNLAIERLQHSGWIKPTPAASPAAKKPAAQRNAGPFVLGAALLLLLGLSAAFMLIEGFPVMLALLLGIAVLAIGAWGAFRCLFPVQPLSAEDSDFPD